MKWYNEDKTKMIDLDKISGYVYIRAEDYVEKNPNDSDKQDFQQNGDKLELIIGGSVFVFRGSQAKEIYNSIPKELDERKILGD